MSQLRSVNLLSIMMMMMMRTNLPNAWAFLDNILFRLTNCRVSLKQWSSNVIR